MWGSQAMSLDSFEEYELITFIKDYLEMYPLSEIRDIYKLLYQSFNGAEHAISDRETVESQFNMEWSEIETDERYTNVPFNESICIKNLTPPLYRIHLVPAKAQGVNKRYIINEFLRTAGEFPEKCRKKNRDLDLLFRDAWNDFGNAIDTGEIKFDYRDYLEFMYVIESSGWPAMHHSEQFRELYNPHYRIVMRPEVFENIVS